MKKETKNHRPVHVHHTVIMSLPYIFHTHILSFHVCTLHRFVVHASASTILLMYANNFFLPALVFNRISYQRCCNDISLPISQDLCVCVCVCYCFLCFHLKMINRFFSLFKWARTITSFSGVRVCLCVAFSSVMNCMHLLKTSKKCAILLVIADVCYALCRL